MNGTSSRPLIKALGQACPTPQVRGKALRKERLRVPKYPIYEKYIKQRNHSQTLMARFQRNYKANLIECINIFIIYKQQGMEKALEYADKVFGKSEVSNEFLAKKLLLTDKGGWKNDWLTDMYRDLDKIFKKYSI